MSDSPFQSNDNGPAHSGSIVSDAHGQAALLLAESTLHTLVKQQVLTNRDAILTVRIAREVDQELVEYRNGSDRRTNGSLSLLAAIERSFAADASDGPQYSNGEDAHIDP